MAQNAQYSFSVVLGSAVADIFNPPTLTGGTPAIGAPFNKTKVWFRLFRFINTDTSPHQVTIYKGATGGSAAGTERLFNKNVPASDYLDYWMDDEVYYTTDFLTGKADTGGKVTIIGFGQIGIQ